MESAIVQSFSRPNNSNGLFHTDTFCAASEAIMTVHSVWRNTGGGGGEQSAGAMVGLLCRPNNMNGHFPKGQEPDFPVRILRVHLSSLMCDCDGEGEYFFCFNTAIKQPAASKENSAVEFFFFNFSISDRNFCFNPQVLPFQNNKQPKKPCSLSLTRTVTRVTAMYASGKEVSCWVSLKILPSYYLHWSHFESLQMLHSTQLGLLDFSRALSMRSLSEDQSICVKVKKTWKPVEVIVVKRKQNKHQLNSCFF